MEININAEARFIEICGVKYSYELFEAWGRNGIEKDTLFRIMGRVNGMITLQTIDIGALKLPD